MHTSDLPEEWKEIEEEESAAGIEIYNMLGPLAVLIYHRIVEMKILSGINLEGDVWNFLKPVLDYYDFYSAKSAKDPKAGQKVK